MVERVSGTIPQFMINQAPADVKEMFDDRGRVKAELVAPDRQSRVNRLMLLPVRLVAAQKSLPAGRHLFSHPRLLSSCVV
jgi:hypothetical protein